MQTKKFSFLDKKLEKWGIKADRSSTQESVELFEKVRESSYLLECLNTATFLFKLNEFGILAVLEASTQNVEKHRKISI